MQKFVRPVEEMYKFHVWNSRPLDIGFFKAKPMVLLIGGYSVGKTSFIKYLLGRLVPAHYTREENTRPRVHACRHPHTPPPSGISSAGELDLNP